MMIARSKKLATTALSLWGLCFLFATEAHCAGKYSQTPGAQLESSKECAQDTVGTSPQINDLDLSSTSSFSANCVALILQPKISFDFQVIKAKKFLLRTGLSPPTNLI